MAYNKFGGGFGGGQMQQLMKQAQQMQQEIQKAQEELENAQLEGVAGGGLVKVVVNGKKVLQNVSINPDAVDTDDIEMLEDLILAAYNAACEQADKLSDEKLGAYNKMGGMF
ncbi:MAG: YbaB/EbfC family nucleoid-associated protein [Clostridia bacterium]|nr:YbaB/EbfC family nucleoid-associated protein [Clostridia bacterium]MBQ4586634.1 YbaB/EbfC family nucleoid-associated protein [Clostridia bacterium]MBQ6883051.1 YbaB/EbfC family nucleoid-associated protein [Clostridia bacterium]MBR2933205.1 YbaB/EbfC family nucleoid-associated protein [Clostridia bacterium]MBR6688130.1 YbaB/EbfC family nucleoid-associated protein [Clostridia bacterium]